MQVCFPVITSLITAAISVNSVEKSLHSGAFVASWVAVVVMENDIGVSSLTINLCINTSGKGLYRKFYSRYSGVEEVVESRNLGFLCVIILNSDFSSIYRTALVMSPVMRKPIGVPLTWW